MITWENLGNISVWNTCKSVQQSCLRCRLVGVTPTRSTWLLLLIAFTCFSFVLTDNTVWLPSGQQMILEQATSCIDNDPQSLVLSWLVGFVVLINSSFHSSVLGMRGKLLCNWNHYKICMSADLTVQPAERLWLRSSQLSHRKHKPADWDWAFSCFLSLAMLGHLHVVQFLFAPVRILRWTKLSWGQGDHLEDAAARPLQGVGPDPRGQQGPGWPSDQTNWPGSWELYSAREEFKREIEFFVDFIPSSSYHFESKWKDNNSEGWKSFSRLNSPSSSSCWIWHEIKSTGKWFWKWKSTLATD